MNTLKKVGSLVGSKKDNSGQEPVSGLEGQGSASEPFDAGNQEDKPELGGKAPQNTDPSEEPPQPTAEEGKSSEPVDSKTEEPSEPSSNGTSGDANPISKLIKKPTIGSSKWFTNANPFSKNTGESEASGDQPVDPKDESAKAEPTESTSGLPPNHLGDDVPPGPHSVIVEPSSHGIEDPAFSTESSSLPNHLGEDVPPGQLAATVPVDKGKGKAKMTDADFQDESSSAASNFSSGTRNESVATDYTVTSKNTYSTAGTGASTLASRRQSATQAPYSQGKPITAGGIVIGSQAMQDRERRLSSVIPERDYASIDNMTASNTQRNSGIAFSDAGPSLSKHQEVDFNEKAPAISTPTNETPKQTRFGSVDTKVGAGTTEMKEGRRHSSFVGKANDLRRKFSQRIKPSRPSK